MPKTNPKANSWRKSVKNWKKEHDFESDEAFKYVMERLSSDSSKKSYRYHLPYFFQFVDMMPTEIIERRAQDRRRDVLDTERRFFENKAEAFKAKMVSLDYSGGTIINYIGAVCGFFSNYDKALSLDMDRDFWKTEESQERKAIRRRKDPPTNTEIKKMYAVADRKTRIALLFGYQCGLAPTDVIKLTWANLNIDYENEEREFIPVDHTRNKTGEQGTIIINPDLLRILKGEWVEQGRPDEGHILNYRGEPIKHSYRLNQWINEYAVKALGEERAKEVRFKDLRDSFNNTIKNTPGIIQEFADRLMGHSVAGARGSYFVGDAELILYREIFERLTVNGWLYREKAEGYEELSSEIDQLREALSQVEKENTAYKTRLDNLQQLVTSLREDFNIVLETLKEEPDN